MTLMQSGDEDAQRAGLLLWRHKLQEQVAKQEGGVAAELHLMDSKVADLIRAIMADANLSDAEKEAMIKHIRQTAAMISQKLSGRLRLLSSSSDRLQKQVVAGNAKLKGVIEQAQLVVDVP